MRYYKIMDDCGCEHYICVPPEIDVMLAPHIRSAERITQEEYEAERSERREQHELPE